MAHVVLIEDDALLSEMYQQALINAGFECSVALDGKSGLDLALDIKPDLILLDLMLPQMSGDQVLTRLRQSKHCKDTRVMIMTNISKSEAPESLDYLGFELYIVKANTTLHEVVEIVKSIVSPPSVANNPLAS